MTQSHETQGEWRARILLGASLTLVVLAVITVLPLPSHNLNLLAYRSVCAFVPLSTFTPLGGAGFTAALRSSSRRGGARRA